MEKKHSNWTEGYQWKKGFLIIVGGQSLSLIGSSAVQFSLIWWLASETASPLILSLAGLLAFLPQLVLGPFAGVWVDRLKRKAVLIGADLFIGLVAALFAISFYLWHPPAWVACSVLGVRAVGNVFHTPAIQAAIPMLVPQTKLVRANGWNQLVQSGAYLLGPIVGAAMFSAWPLPLILLSDLLGAMVASAAVAMVKIPEIKREKLAQPDFIREIREGMTVFLNDQKLGAVTLAVAVSMFFFMPLSSLYPLMVSELFQAAAWHASINQLAYSIGMMLGAFAMSSIGTLKNQLGAVYMGLAVLGVSTLLCGLLPHNMSGFWMFLLLCLLMGASVNLCSIPYTAYLQERVPQEAQGRAFSLWGSLMSATMPLGLLIAGPMAERYGLPLWFLVAGLAMAILPFSRLVAALFGDKGTMVL